MFDITFYKTASEKNRLTKHLTLPVTFSGELKEESSILDPIITLEANVDITGYNYLYIEILQRYYFITNIVIVRNNIFRITCHVDVLMSYSEGIKNQEVIISKQENSEYTSLLFDDNSFRTSEENFIEVANFSNGFNSGGEFILLTAGAIGGV